MLTSGSIFGDGHARYCLLSIGELLGFSLGLSSLFWLAGGNGMLLLMFVREKKYVDDSGRIIWIEIWM